MDRKTFITALLWATVAFLLWNILANNFLTPKAPTTQPSLNNLTPDFSTPPSHSPVQPTPYSNQPETSPAEGVRFLAKGADSEQLVHIGNGGAEKENPFRLDLILSSRGASVQDARLTDHTESMEASTNGEPTGYRLLKPVTNQSLSGGDWNSYAVVAVQLSDSQQDRIFLRDVNWNLVTNESKADKDIARFQVDITNKDNEPVLRLTKTYRLPQQPLPDDRGKQRHDLFIDWEFENYTDSPIRLILAELGPMGMKSEFKRMEDRNLFAAIPVADSVKPVEVESELFGKIGTKYNLYRRDSANGYAWSGMSNKFFTAISAPLTADGKQNPTWINGVDAVDLDGNEETVDDCTLSIASLFTIPAKEVFRWGQHTYLGPADKKTFTSTHNADYAKYGFDSVINLGYSSCTFSWLADIMVWLLDLLESVIPNYGIAIIILVLVVRAILHPMTKKGQVNMVRMQERMGSLQPKLERLKEQYGNDKARMQQEQMKLYSEEGINPATSMLSSCMPMAIQMPIWIALYTSLSNNVAMRHHGFCLWINDLTSPDALITFSQEYNVPILSWMAGPVESLNILPILLGITMYAQQKLMPKPSTPATGAQADQAAMMQKMMPMMSIFFALILYNMPSGLNLYIMASTLFGTIEQIYVRKHIKDMKERGDIIQPSKDDGKPKKQGWLGKRFEELQKQAEIQQQIRNQGKKKK